MNERERIALLARVLAARAPGVAQGIGDDAAVLDGAVPGGPTGSLVWTIDEQVEGVHFRRELLSWRDVGWRSFMAAASDLAAMGAAPWCALCALVLPDDLDDRALEAIATGQRDAGAALGAPVVGGNLSRGPALSLATTLLGRCDRPVLRRGALPGDGLWLAGRVGLAAAGLRALEQGPAIHPSLAPAIEAWRSPRALVAEGLAMGQVAHAAIDVSDGLARDVGHMAEASGVQAVVFEEALLEDRELGAAAIRLGALALDLALHGGEDYALAVASPEPIAGFRQVGAIRPGTGLVLRTAAGEQPLEPRGFDHFTSPSRRPGASGP
jgi:thiamine-monophosphate kinase